MFRFRGRTRALEPRSGTNTPKQPSTTVHQFQPSPPASTASNYMHIISVFTLLTACIELVHQIDVRGHPNSYPESTPVRLIYETQRDIEAPMVRRGCVVHAGGANSFLMGTHQRVTGGPRGIGLINLGYKKRGGCKGRVWGHGPAGAARITNCRSRFGRALITPLRLRS